MTNYNGLNLYVNHLSCFPMIRWNQASRNCIHPNQEKVQTNAYSLALNILSSEHSQDFSGIGIRIQATSIFDIGLDLHGGVLGFEASWNANFVLAVAETSFPLSPLSHERLLVRPGGDVKIPTPTGGVINTDPISLSVVILLPPFPGLPTSLTADCSGHLLPEQQPIDFDWGITRMLTLFIIVLYYYCRLICSFLCS
jgi:hypothetical protein